MELNSRRFRKKNIYKKESPASITNIIAQPKSLDQIPKFFLGIVLTI